MRLESRHNLPQLLITMILKFGQHARLEEHFRFTHSEVLVRQNPIRNNLVKHRFACLLCIVRRFRLFGAQNRITLFEIRMKVPVREAFAANANALKHTVASQLVEHQRRFEQPGGLFFVRDDATNEMRMRLVQHRHQFVERLAVNHRDGQERAGFAYNEST